MLPFRSDGTWLRCQLHAHTVNSDGEATPEGLAAHYARAGYDVLAITDHWHVTDHASEDILVVPSSELSAGVDHLIEEADVLALGAATLPEPREQFASIEDAARWIVEAGGVAFLAHPYWSGLEPGHYLDAPSLSGMEVYNGGSELSNGNGSSVEVWDSVLHRGGVGCFGIACDDCHYPGWDSRVAWTVVRAAERSIAAVVDALRTGSFYASSGPRIEDVAIGADGVEVHCSPAASVTLRSGPWDGGRVNAATGVLSWRGTVLERDRSGMITRALLRFPEQWEWGRVEVRAGDGSTAWTNAFPLPLDTSAGAESNR